MGTIKHSVKLRKKKSQRILSATGPLKEKDLWDKMRKKPVIPLVSFS